MRLGLRIPGFAAARQGQAEERPRLDFARVQSVSPWWTLIVRVALVLVLRALLGVATTKGRLSWEPTRLWVGSTIRGLPPTNSSHQLPRPRFCCANYQSESPDWTRTIFRVEITGALG